MFKAPSASTEHGGAPAQSLVPERREKGVVLALRPVASMGEQEQPEDVELEDAARGSSAFRLCRALRVGYLWATGTPACVGALLDETSMMRGEYQSFKASLTIVNSPHQTTSLAKVSFD